MGSALCSRPESELESAQDPNMIQKTGPSIVFTFPMHQETHTWCIMLFNDLTGEASKFQDPMEHSLEFANTKTVVVNKVLYAFKEGEPV